MYENLERRISDMEATIRKLSQDASALRAALEQKRMAASASLPRCVRCGATLEKDALFCTNCGLRIQGVPGAGPVAAPSPESFPAQAVTPAPTPVMTPPTDVAEPEESKPEESKPEEIVSEEIISEEIVSEESTPEQMAEEELME